MLEILTVCMMISALAAFGLRNYKKSVLAYQICATLLVATFFTIYMQTGIKELLTLSIVGIFTKVLFVPIAMFYLIKKLNLVSEDEPVAGFFVSPVIAVSFSLAVSMGLYNVFKEFALINIPLALVASGFIFMVGIFGFILRNSFIKQILSYCLFENGIHLTMALLAYDAHEIVELGILTDAIFAVVIMGVLAIRFYKSYGSVDTSKATNLRG
ncbi:hydrogenase 4 membrane subunit [Campylobacter sp. MG1]|uniref:hydrogenase 4 membrane subunit n=1 Tax=Campylobacter sp. MG1 TaxID=2976332 RepID=UPI00226CEC19|nr:hydrogenase 4 membrane subunit [Campylobacter sp. MG1]